MKTNVEFRIGFSWNSQILTWKLFKYTYLCDSISVLCTHALLLIYAHIYRRITARIRTRRQNECARYVLYLYVHIYIYKRDKSGSMA